MPFPDQSLTTEYYSIRSGMLNQQKAIVKLLTGGFSPRREGFGGFPSHAICATLHIKSTWNFTLLGLSVLCGCSACVCMCARGNLFPLTHSLVKLCMHENIQSCRIFHLCHEARPPLAFLTCNHVQICTGRQGEGENHVNLCGCFLFLLYIFFSFRLTKSAPDYRPFQRSKSPSEASQMPNLFLSVFFLQLKLKLG